MSVHTDCRVTTWIRNSNRRSIKVADKSEPRQRRHKEREREASRSITVALNKQASSQTHHFDLKTDKSETDLPAAEMMPVCTVLEKRNGVVVGAELSCSVREENKTQRESYSADWHSVSLKTQAQDR